MAEEHIHSFLATHEQNGASNASETRAKCCCGNDACVYLKHNQNALIGLEKDVSTAARLGKALLVRHESYIADSERERRNIMMNFEALEMEKQTLERKNAAAIDENRSLLDQLESVNNAVAESDAHVTSLQETLKSTQQELSKLQSLASRTDSLERQIAEFEREQANWQSSYETKAQSEKFAVRRWQKAERVLADLQDQMERIEREASEERERHGEVVERMERRHAVQKELVSAAGRLKNAAALKNNGANTTGNNVVSHFVKDILQDNANLQMGIVELREMLTTSNEEVEVLRRQLTLHQPAEEDDDDTPQPPAQRSDLRAELTRANSQELHVHHHYHAPPNVPKSLKKPKKRHGVLASGKFTPPSGASTPRSSFSHGSPTPTAAILQQTAASIPQHGPHRKRLSIQSNQTFQSTGLSSGPPSPQSTNRTSSVFDRVFSDADHESSRPNTPDTEDPGSPPLAPVHVKRGSSSSFRTYSAPVVQRRGFSPADAGRPNLDSVMSYAETHGDMPSFPGQDAIPEENEAEWKDQMSPPCILSEDGASTSESSAPILGLNNEDDRDSHFIQPQRPHPLRRSTSHESILSVSAMDVHTLKSRPSQLLAPYGGRGITSQAVISDATAQATRPAHLSRVSGSISSRTLLSGVAAERQQQRNSAGEKGATLGQKVGGWVFGKWGGAVPTPGPGGVPAEPGARPKDVKRPNYTTTGSVSSAASVLSSSAADETKSAGVGASTTPKTAKARSPGINQMGPVVGLGPELKTKHAPVVSSLDEEELKVALGGK